MDGLAANRITPSIAFASLIERHPCDCGGVLKRVWIVNGRMLRVGDRKLAWNRSMRQNLGAYCHWYLAEMASALREACGPCV